MMLGVCPEKRLAETMAAFLCRKTFGTPDYQARIGRESLSVVMVQFRALGLIAKTGGSNLGTYWSLTPYGESYLMQLNAIKRPVVQAGAVTIGVAASSPTRN
jgi:hypothetical protein